MTSNEDPVVSSRATYESTATLRGNSENATENTPDVPKTKSIWNLLANSGSITLENKGSVARDHMANERTFLAWLRTSLSFITIGIGVTQLFRLEDKASKVNINASTIALAVAGSKGKIIDKYGKPLGSSFIIIGILTLLLGFVRFFQVQQMLTKNYYPASRLSILSLIALIFLVIIVTFVMVLKSSI